ncbi:hypothetical protein SARC_10383, partial [Sphaeroforma arctica JP610]
QDIDWLQKNHCFDCTYTSSQVPISSSNRANDPMQTDSSAPSKQESSRQGLDARGDEEQYRDTLVSRSAGEDERDDVLSAAYVLGAISSQKSSPKEPLTGTQPVSGGDMYRDKQGSDMAIDGEQASSMDTDTQPCTWEGCGHISQTLEDMLTHMRTHTMSSLPPRRTRTKREVGTGRYLSGIAPQPAKAGKSGLFPSVNVKEHHLERSVSQPPPLLGDRFVNRTKSAKTERAVSMHMDSHALASPNADPKAGPGSGTGISGSADDKCPRSEGENYHPSHRSKGDNSIEIDKLRAHMAEVNAQEPGQDLFATSSGGSSIVGHLRTPEVSGIDRRSFAAPDPNHPQNRGFVMDGSSANNRATTESGGPASRASSLREQGSENGSRYEADESVRRYRTFPLESPRTVAMRGVPSAEDRDKCQEHDTGARDVMRESGSGAGKLHSCDWDGCTYTGTLEGLLKHMREHTLSVLYPIADMKGDTGNQGYARERQEKPVDGIRSRGHSSSPPRYSIPGRNAASAQKSAVKLNGAMPRTRRGTQSRLSQQRSIDAVARSDRETEALRERAYRIERDKLPRGEAPVSEDQYAGNSQMYDRIKYMEDDMTDERDRDFKETRAYTNDVLDKRSRPSRRYDYKYDDEYSDRGVSAERGGEGERVGMGDRLDGDTEGMARSVSGVDDEGPLTTHKVPSTHSLPPAASAEDIAAQEHAESQIQGRVTFSNTMPLNRPHSASLEREKVSATRSLQQGDMRYMGEEDSGSDRYPRHSFGQDSRYRAREREPESTSKYRRTFRDDPKGAELGTHEDVHMARRQSTSSSTDNYDRHSAAERSRWEYSDLERISSAHGSGRGGGPNSALTPPVGGIKSRSRSPRPHPYAQTNTDGSAGLGGDTNGRKYMETAYDQRKSYSSPRYMDTDARTSREGADEHDEEHACDWDGCQWTGSLEGLLAHMRGHTLSNLAVPPSGTRSRNGSTSGAKNGAKNGTNPGRTSDVERSNDSPMTSPHLDRRRNPDENASTSYYAYNREPLPPDSMSAYNDTASVRPQDTAPHAAQGSGGTDVQIRLPGSPMSMSMPRSSNTSPQKLALLQPELRQPSSPALVHPDADTTRPRGDMTANGNAAGKDSHKIALRLSADKYTTTPASRNGPEYMPEACSSTPRLGSEDTRMAPLPSYPSISVDGRQHSPDDTGTDIARHRSAGSSRKSMGMASPTTNGRLSVGGDRVVESRQSYSSASHRAAGATPDLDFQETACDWDGCTYVGVDIINHMRMHALAGVPVHGRGRGGSRGSKNSSASYAMRVSNGNSSGVSGYERDLPSVDNREAATRGESSPRQRVKRSRSQEVRSSPYPVSTGKMNALANPDSNLSSDRDRGLATDGRREDREGSFGRGGPARSPISKPRGYQGSGDGERMQYELEPVNGTDKSGDVARNRARLEDTHLHSNARRMQTYTPGHSQSRSLVTVPAHRSESMGMYEREDIRHIRDGGSRPASMELERGFDRHDSSGISGPPPNRASYRSYSTTPGPYTSGLTHEQAPAEYYSSREGGRYRDDNRYVNEENGYGNRFGETVREQYPTRIWRDQEYNGGARSPGAVDANREREYAHEELAHASSRINVRNDGSERHGGGFVDGPSTHSYQYSPRSERKPYVRQGYDVRIPQGFERDVSTKAYQEQHDRESFDHRERNTDRDDALHRRQPSDSQAHSTMRGTPQDGAGNDDNVRNGARDSTARDGDVDIETCDWDGCGFRGTIEDLIGHMRSHTLSSLPPRRSKAPPNPALAPYRTARAETKVSEKGNTSEKEITSSQIPVPRVDVTDK